MRENIFSVEANTASSEVNYIQPELVLTQSDLSALKFEENKSIIQTAFETLQFDLNEFPICVDKKESTNSLEQINVTYSPIPPINGFTDSDIDNHTSILPDIDTSCINNEFSVVPNCNPDESQDNFFSKAYMAEPGNFNSSGINNVILADNEKQNICIKQANVKSSEMDKHCWRDNCKCASSQQSTAENFYVQIIRETGEMSRSVLTMDSSSAQVLKRNWEDIVPE